MQMKALDTYKEGYVSPEMEVLHITLQARILDESKTEQIEPGEDVPGF